MATRQCGRCGGQMSSYSSTCPWCGRSTWSTAFLQLCSFAAVMGGLLYFTGMIRKQDIVAFFEGGGAAVETAAATPAEAPPAPAVRTSRRAGGARREAAAAAPAAPPAPAPAAAAESCSSAARVERLRRQHGEWSTRELELVSCGEVEPGFSEAHVRAALGEPVSVDRTALPETWRYGAVSVLVENGRVVGVSR